MKKDFLNFQVDHMTLLVSPELYNVAYLIFRIVFGVSRENLLYEKRKSWTKGEPEESMTFAVRIGSAASEPAALQKTVIAVVQPTEPETQPSHVRSMLVDHRASSHWQHIALRVPDLLAFHQYALARGVNFITPILKDAEDDLVQVFSGEWYLPGGVPTGMFFEFVQRNPTEGLLQKLEERNRESWFRDKTFMGLYAIKEQEYRGGKVMPFMDEGLMRELHAGVKGKKLWEISEEDVAAAEAVMLSHSKAPKPA